MLIFFAPLLIPDLTASKKCCNACAIVPTLESTVSFQTQTTEFYIIVPYSFFKNSTGPQQNGRGIHREQNLDSIHSQGTHL